MTRPPTNGAGAAQQLTRQSLRDAFADGKLPTSRDFANLIESSLNLKDQGFDKTDDDGLQVRSAAGCDALLSFYRDINADQPLWSAAFHDRRNQFVMRSGGALAPGNPLITLDRGDAAAEGEPPPAAGAGLPGGEGATSGAAAEAELARTWAERPERVGIGTSGRPRCALDVAGSVGMVGRLGAPPAQPQVIVADGEWKPLVTGLVGLQALEIVAAVGGAPKKGRYALMHAVALNAYNPSWWDNFWFGRRSIRMQHAFYRRRADRLQLRWVGGHGEGAQYGLEIRSGCDYLAEERRTRQRAGQKLPGSEEAHIQVHVTRLWHDPLLQQPGARPR